MTLVPIIYTSLLIFSSFLLIVIIVSYISYKAKSRNQVLNHNVWQPSVISARRDLDILRKKSFSSSGKVVGDGFQLSAQPAFISNKANRQAPVRVTNSNPPDVFQNSPLKRRNERSNYSSSTINLRPHSSSNRIEVLNRTENSNHSSTENYYEAAAPFRFSEHSEINLLNFYSDTPARDFTTLSAGRGSCDD